MADVVLKLTIDASGAIQVLDATGNAVAQIGVKARSSAQEAKSSFDQLNQGMSDFLRQSLAVATGFTLAGAIHQAIEEFKSLISLGVTYAATLEQSRIGIAAILQGTTTLVNSQGQQLSTTAAWAVNLGVAAGLQQHIAELSASTLGTQQELLSIFQVVLAFSRGQVATDEQRLTIAQGLLNLTKLLNLQNEQQVVREALTLQRAQGFGVLLLSALNLTVEQARQYQLQGTYLQELNTRLQVYNALAQEAALTWRGLTTTVQTFGSLIAAASFAGIFTGLKEVLIGIRDELTIVQHLADLSVPVQASAQELQHLGAVAADAFIGIFQALASLVAGVIDFAASIARAATLVTTVGAAAGQITGLATAFSLLGTGLGVLGINAQTTSIAVSAITNAAIIAGVTALALEFGGVATAIAGVLTVATALAANPLFIPVFLAGLAATGLSLFINQLTKTRQEVDLTNVQFHQLPDAVNLATVAVQALGNPLLTASGGIKRVTIDLAEGGKAAAESAKLVEEAAKAYATLQDTIAKATLNPALALQSQLNLIEAERKRELEQARQAGVTDTSAVEETAAIKRLTAELNNNQQIISAIKQRTAEDIQGTQAAAAAAVSAATGRLTLLNQQSSAIQAQVQLEREANAPLAEQEAVQARLLAVRKQIAQADIEQATARQAEAQANLTKLTQEQAQFPQQLAVAQAALAKAATPPETETANARIIEIQRSLAGVGAEITKVTGTLTEQSNAIAAAQTKVSEVAVQAGKEAVTNTQNFIAQEKLKTESILQDIQTRAAAEAAANQAEATRLTANQGLLQARLDLLKAQSAPIQQQIPLIQQLLDLDRQKVELEQRAAEAAIRSATETIAALQGERADIQASIDALQGLDDIFSRIERRELAASLRGINQELSDQNTLLTAAKAHADAAGIALQTGAVKAQTAFQTLQNEIAKTAFLSQNSIGTMLEQITTGILQGTQSIGNILSSVAQGLGVKFFSQLIAGKQQNLDVPLIENISQLVFSNGGGIIGALFSAGGALAAQQFANSWGGALAGSGASALFGNTAQGTFGPGTIFSTITGQAGQAGSSAAGLFGSTFGAGLLPDLQGLFGSGGVASSLFDNIFNGSAGFGANLATGFQSLGGIAAGFLGAGLGKGLSALFGVGGSAEGQTGGSIGSLLGGIGGFAVGGPLGSFIGSALGDLLGGFFGDLFAHVPTAGTQIRQGVQAWLKSIGVTFADEINSATYFFEDTKALAAKMFGGDFLAASKDILTTKVGPEIAKQLQALGTFITADQAAKLGKSVEQTGTTFGNLLVANLGVDKIPAAIAEVVSKGQISFQALTDKLTSVFQAGKIGVDFYKDAIMGAVGIFTTNLPAGIDVAKLAMDSFTKEGIFDLTAFQAKIKDVADVAKNIQDSLTKAITAGVSGNLSTAQVEINFKTNLQQVVRDALVAKTIAEGLADVFKGIDLTKPLDSATVDVLAGRVGALYDNVQKVLGAAGQLSGAFSSAVGSTSALTDEISATEAKVTSLAKSAGLTASQIIDAAAAIAKAEAIPIVAKEGVTALQQFQASFDAALASAGLTAAQIKIIDDGLKAAGLSAASFAAGLQNVATESATLAQAAKDATAAADLKGGSFAADIRSAAATAVSDGIKNGASATEIVASFTKGLESSIATSITNAVVTGFTNAALTSGALAPALAKITDLENSYIAGKIDLSTFTKGVQGAFAAAKPLIEALATALGVTGVELEKALAPITGGASGGTLADHVHDAEVAWRDAHTPAQATADAAKGAAENTSAMVDALQAALAAAGLTSGQIDNVKNAMTAAGGAGADVVKALQDALTAAGLTTPELKKVQESLTAAGVAGDAMAKSLADALAKTGLLPPTLKDAGSEADGVRGAMEKALATITSSASQAQALATALQAAAIAAASINIPAAPAAAGKAGGGLVSIAGTGDTVPAMLAPGEFVVNAKDAQKNFALLAQINAGMEVARFASGGPVPGGPNPLPPSEDPNALHGLALLQFRALTDTHLAAALQQMGLAAKGATTTIADLTKQLDAVIQRRRDIATSLADQLGQIGVFSPLDVVTVKIKSLTDELTPLIDKWTAGTKLSADDLKRAEDLTGSLRAAVVERYNAEVAELQKVHTGFQTAATKVQDILNQILQTGPGMAPTEQLAQLDIQAAALQQKLAAALPADQPQLIQNLATVLQQKLTAAASVFAPGDQRLIDVRDAIVSQLQMLNARAQAGAGTNDMTAAITALQDAATQELQHLAAQQDALAAAQQALLQQQLTATTHTAAVADQANLLLQSIDMRLKDLAAGLTVTGSVPLTVTSAQGGFEGDITAPRLLLVHPGETASVRPTGSGTGAPLTLHLNFPGLVIHVDGGQDSAKQGTIAGRAFMDYLEKNTNKIGTLIFQSKAGLDFARKVTR